jgi:hypothetical protein
VAVKEKGEAGGHEPAAQRSLVYSAIRGAGIVRAMHSTIVSEPLAPVRAMRCLSGAV